MGFTPGIIENTVRKFENSTKIAYIGYFLMDRTNLSIRAIKTNIEIIPETQVLYPLIKHSASPPPYITTIRVTHPVR